MIVPPVGGFVLPQVVLQVFGDILIHPFRRQTVAKGNLLRAEVPAAEFDMDVIGHHIVVRRPAKVARWPELSKNDRKELSRQKENAERSAYHLERSFKKRK